MRNSDEPYGPHRFKNIMEECYVICKSCNTPYTDLLDITIKEKKELLRLIKEEHDRTEAELAKVREKNKNKRNR